MRYQLALAALFVIAAAVSAQEPPPAASASPPPAVDSASDTGSEFVSDRFKLHYQLPDGWKALSDATRVAENQRYRDQYAHPVYVNVPSSKSKSVPTKPPANGNATHRAKAPVVPENYCLMAASPNGMSSLDNAVLPRINIWADQRVPTVDSAEDHIRMLKARGEVLLAPAQLSLAGHTFVRIDVLQANGIYHSQFVTVAGDYLVGFDLYAATDEQLTAMVQTMQSVHFD
jgi:hypothetical protein